VYFQEQFNASLTNKEIQRRELVGDLP